MTFLGQFLDHDMTFDPTSSLARRQDPEAIRNFRIPSLDLDNVYGGGPGRRPRTSTTRRVDGGRTSSSSRRSPASAAVSADGFAALRPAAQQPEHRAHRRPAQRREPDRLPAAPGVAAVPQRRRGPTSRPTSGSRHARRGLRRGAAPGALALPVDHRPRVPAPRPSADGWSTTSSTTAASSTSGATHPFIPVEFSVAAYRFGHSQVRPSYRANFGTTPPTSTQQFFALIFDDSLPDRRRPGRPARRQARPDALHRLADVLRLRRRQRAARTRRSTPSCPRCCSTCLGQPPGDAQSLAQPQPAAPPHLRPCPRASAWPRR